MKTLSGILIIICLFLQFRLWVGEGSLAYLRLLELEVSQQRDENQILIDRNGALAADVRDLKSGLETIEERARSELGMIKSDETFYLIIP